MISTTVPHANSPQFRRRWRGYDRAEVDEFLRRTAADRRQLHEDLAQIEAVIASRSGVPRGELERLTALRTEVATCLEAGVTALQTASRRLSAPDEPGPVPASHEAPDHAPAWFRPRRPAVRWPLPEWRSIGRRYVALGAVSSVALLLLAFTSRYEPRATPIPVASAAASQDVPLPVGPPARTAEPADAPADGLLLTLTARGPCWVRTTVDAGQPLERLLQQNDTILLRASDEAALRVGDAGALSLLINNQPARPLGAPGQVVAMRITRTNYSSFVQQPDGAPATDQSLEHR